MSRKPTKKLISTAYHEAGHAVAAYDLGIKIRRATIVAQDDYLGVVIHEQIQKHIRDALEFGSITPAKRVRTESFVIVTIAGSVAERKHRGRANHIGAQSDYLEAVDLLSRLTGSNEEIAAYYRWLHVRTVNLIELYWWAVEAVAQALLTSKTLTGDEVQHVIREASDRQIQARTKT